MDSSGYWDHNSTRDVSEELPNNSNSVHLHNTSSLIATSPQHQVQTQGIIPEGELIDSIASASASDNNYLVNEDGGENLEDLSTNMDSNVTSALDQPTLEQVQRVYYAKGLDELESLQLLDISPLANWKLSSFKQGFGLAQLRDDSPDSFWQSDGSNGTNNTSNNAISNSQLSNPHSITVQFSKKVSIERISIFTNFSLDESYTPSKIKIMAGSSDGWDLSEVCTVNFNKPIGWSHIIFNGIRNDGVLKCFIVKIIILANHQDGKDSHIRAIRCFGRRSTISKHPIRSSPGFLHDNRSINLSGSGLLLDDMEEIDTENSKSEVMVDKETDKVLENVTEVLGFNSGFQSLELKSTSSIR